MATATIPTTTPITSTGATGDSAAPISLDQGAGNGTPSLIVTSDQSRTNYADNLNKMNQMSTSMAPATSISTSTDANGNVTSFNSDGTRTTTDKTGNKITPSTPVNVFADSPSGAKVTGSTAETDGSMTIKYDDGSTARFVQNADGTYKQDSTGGTSTSGTTATGTDNGTGNDETSYKNASLDPTVMKQYQDSLGNLDKGIQSAKDALDSATATLQNDPAAQNAVAQIMDKYDKQIALMKDKNALLLGTYKTNAARNGTLQYANDMYSDFMSEEQDKATTRITDLINQETQLVLKTQQAYKDGDVKALSAATKAYDEANKSKIDAIKDLLTATNNQVKSMQAQAKIDAASSKQEISDNIRVSTSIAKTIADNIAKSGVTDESKISDYIQAMADQNGITNPDILKSAVAKATQDTSKFNLSQENVQSTINKRNTTSTSKPKALTTTAVIKEAGGIFTTGANAKGVKVGAPRGEDGFVDPYLYISMYNQIKNDPALGPSGVNAFLKAYPPLKYINPENETNPDVPEEIRNALIATKKK